MRFLFLFLCALVAPHAQAQQAEGVVRVAQGLLQGFPTDDGLALAYRGVPFAAPPTGQLRFAPPAPAPAWEGTFQAGENGRGCLQTCKLPPFACPPAQGEDCLFLNVFTPRGPPAEELLPVFVWLHGGNFFQGYGGSVLYDGRYWANRTGTIVVVPNYRLGVLGFAAAFETAPNGTVTPVLPGNYGLQDQVAALQWVRGNIRAFGGDPNRVTLGGQSAGSVSVAAHLSYGPSQGLFHQAVLESEPLALPFRGRDSWNGAEAAFANFSGCAPPDVACLRAVAPADVVRAQDRVMTDLLVDLAQPLSAFVPFTPVAGTPDIPLAPMQALLRGRYSQMPVLVGNTAQEATLFVGEAFAKPVAPSEYAAVLDAVFGLLNGGGARVAARYPCAKGAADCRGVMAEAATDGLFLCANRNVTRTVSALPEQANNLYYYVFDHAASDHRAWGNESFCYDAACHGVELPFVFHSFFKGVFSWTPAEAALSDRMVAYWTRFVHTGSPNGAGAPEWPAYAAGTELAMRFATPNDTVVSRFDEAACQWWDDTMGYVWP